MKSSTIWEHNYVICKYKSIYIIKNNIKCYDYFWLIYTYHRNYFCISLTHIHTFSLIINAILYSNIQKNRLR